MRFSALPVCSLALCQPSGEPQKASDLTPLDIKKYFPEGLPFPPERLNRVLPQMIDQRHQWLDPQGNFIITDIEKLFPGGQTHRVPLTNKNFSAFIIADIGFNTAQRQSVFSHMRKRIAQEKQHAPQSIVIGDGDLVYPHSMENQSDSEVLRMNQTTLKDARTLKELAPFLTVLGNHEYGDEAGPGNPTLFHQLLTEQGFEMPGRYYRYALDHPDWGVDFFVLDSTTLAIDQKQRQWIEQAVTQSEEESHENGNPRWRILVAHHPIVSYGHHHGRTTFLGKLLTPALNHIDLMVCGHEHDNQMIEIPDLDLPQLICGTACDSRPVSSGLGSLFSSNTSSYCQLAFTPTQLKLTINSLPMTTNHTQRQTNRLDFEYTLTQSSEA